MAESYCNDEAVPGRTGAFFRVLFTVQVYLGRRMGKEVLAISWSGRNHRSFGKPSA